jgi:hypothetical protein
VWVTVELYAQFEVFGALDCKLFSIDQDVGSSGMREFVEESSVRSFGLYSRCMYIPIILGFETFATEAVEVVECRRGAFV